MRRFLILALVLAGGAAAEDSKPRVSFNLLRRDIVEQRLGVAEKKNNEMRQAVLKRLFEESGCKGEQLTEQKVKGSKLPNLVCTLPGNGPGTIIVGAHFDFIGPGSTGIADNWSGASLLPSLYESLSAEPRKHTFVFIGFTDEEQGLVGSGFYARQLTKEQRATTRAMLNIDTVGLSSPKVWSSHADKALLRSLSAVAATMKIPLQGVNVEQVGSSDSESFRDAKIPAITVHSVTQENLETLHSAKDNPAAMNPENYYDTYRLLAVYLAYLDTKEPAAEAVSSQHPDGGKR